MTVEPEEKPKASALENEYVMGFEHGCDYLFNEVRRWNNLNLGTIGDFVAYVEKLSDQNGKVH